MRAIANPNYDGSAVYDRCVASIGNAHLRANLGSVSRLISELGADYHVKASNGSLYLIPPDDSDNGSVYLGVATKRDFQNLYSQQMVGAEKPARPIYDYLLSSAPGGKCPLCGFSQASTLDHYLPKSKYPQFSVLPSNLVPACYECNVGKRNGVASSKGFQSIHPYYDSALILEQWLFAEVVPGSPLSIRYFVAAPTNWTADDKVRVVSHFEQLDLERRFAVEAADELANVRDTIVRYSAPYDPNQIKTDLLATALDKYNIHKNWWQTALLQALGNSDWYCAGGFRQV